MLAVIACFIFGGLAATPHAADAAATLTKDTKALAKIYVLGSLELTELSAKEKRALTPEQVEERTAIGVRIEAVNDLRYILEKMTGAAFDVVQTNDAAAIKPPAIAFGELANQLGAKTSHDTPTDDAYRLQVTNAGLVLFGGESEVAASHAMYRWLHELGCRWIMPGPDGEVIPTQKTLIAKTMDVDKKPAFLVRSPWYSGGAGIIIGDERAQFDQWKRRMGQTHARRHSHPDYLIGGHMWAGLISTFKKELDEDPTMRPLVRQPDGSYLRGRGQLEPTHTGVIDLTVKYIRSMFERNGWDKDKAVAISIGPNDGGGYSESPEALAAGAGRVDPITGGKDQTDVLILYANHVLEAVADEFPNLKLGFYIYSVHADYPMKYKPHPNFVAHFADITYSRFHATQDKQSYTRNYYRNILEQWAALHKEQGNPMWFYGYNWNLAENLLPYTKVRIWGEDLPYYHKMGVIGHNNEQDKGWSILGPHNYIMARLGWDIDADWRDLLDEYCQAAFGDGAEAMVKYYLLLDDRQTNAGVESGAFPSVPLVLGRDFIEEARALFAEATAATNNDIHKRNIDWFGQSVGMLAAFHDIRDAMAEGDYVAARAHYDAMMAIWQKYHDANSNLVSRYGFRYVDRWCLKPALDLMETHSTGDYQLIHQLPDELPTMLDPEDMGQLMGFDQPGMLQKDLMKTKTYSSTWDHQGLGAYRDGGVWYYDRFTVDKWNDGEGIGLAVGAVEDTIHVWVNGKYIGMGRGYMKPFVFDLTEHTTPGEENVIAMQVIRRTYLNEAGLGGMIYPSFVFKGPQLDKVAPAIEPMRRILPGGSRGELEN